MVLVQAWNSFKLQLEAHHLSLCHSGLKFLVSQWGSNPGLPQSGQVLLSLDHQDTVTFAIQECFESTYLLFSMSIFTVSSMCFAVMVTADTRSVRFPGALFKTSCTAPSNCCSHEYTVL